MNLRLRYAVFALCVYAVFLIAGIPAQNAYGWLKPRLPIELYQPSGTLWRGKAMSLQIGNASFDGPMWAFRPQALLLGRIEFALDVTKGPGHVTAGAGRGIDGTRYLRDTDLDMPVSDFVALIGYPGAGLKGRLIAELPKISIRAQRLTEIAGTIQVSDAGLGPPANVSFGGFTLRFENAKQGFRGVIKDTGGPLQADGVINLQPDGNYQLAANLGVRDPTRNDLAQALSFLGPPGPGGRVIVNYNGRIPLDRL